MTIRKTLAGLTIGLTMGLTAGAQAVSPGQTQVAQVAMESVSAYDLEVAIVSYGAYNIEIGVDSYGDPIIDASYDGLDFQVLFYDCDGTTANSSSTGPISTGTGGSCRRPWKFRTATM